VRNVSNLTFPFFLDTQHTTEATGAFVLNFEEKSKNIGGIIPGLIVEYKRKERVEKKHNKITLTFPSIDARDYYDGRWKGTIIDKGRNVRITMPTSPYFY
jgi:hypothetical protein